MDFAYAAAIAVLAFLGGLAGGFFRGYMAEKGKNRAAKEDLGKLTKIVEDIRDTNARGLAKLTAELSAHQTMRSAALEKRLEVHQDAYRVAYTMFMDVFEPAATHRRASDEIRKWWMENALYLDDEPRKAFEQAWLGFVRYPTVSRAEFRGDPKIAIDSIESIRVLPEVIEAAVLLPPISLDAKTQLGVEVPEAARRT
jgi:hypothetical protein